MEKAIKCQHSPIESWNRIIIPDFRIRKGIMDKERHYIIRNMYVPDNRIKIHEVKTDRTEKRNRWNPL